MVVPKAEKRAVSRAVSRVETTVSHWVGTRVVQWVEMKGSQSVASTVLMMVVLKVY